jgi:hypothetical protein
MTRENIKKSSKTGFFLYAVIWGLFVPVLMGTCSFVLAQETVSSVEETIRSLDDPFDTEVRAPDLVKSFLDGVAEMKRQLEEQLKPVKEKTAEPVVQSVLPKPPEPIKPKKLDIPEMKVTGTVYDTDRPQAIINGKVVGVGGVVDGITILKIQKGRIDARYGDSNIILKMNNE